MCFVGGGPSTRTRDLLHFKQMLYRVRAPVTARTYFLFGLLDRCLRAGFLLCPQFHLEDGELNRLPYLLECLIMTHLL